VGRFEDLLTLALKILAVLLLGLLLVSYVGSRLWPGRVDDWLTTQGVTHFSGTVQAAAFRQAQGTALTVTDGAAFSPVNTYCQITAAGTVTPTISTTGYTAGDVFWLVNSGSNTINLADSGTAKLSAAWAAGQYDVLVVQFDGTNWIEISRSDN
jgi:hypothetical protein